MPLRPFLSSLPAGIVMIMLSVGVMAVGAAVASALSGRLVILGDPGDPWVPIATNVSSYTIPDENGTYRIIAHVSNGAVYYLVINTTGDWSAPANGAPTSGTGYRATIVETNATLSGGTTSTGTYNYAAAVGYNAVPEAWVAVVSVSGSQRVFYTISSGTATFDIYRYEPVSGAPGVDLGFIPGLAVSFAGLFMFLKGLRLTMRTRV